MMDLSSELKAACSAASVSPADLILRGETIWLGGWPAPAPKGTIALWQFNRFKLVIRDEDILAVQKQDDMFAVEVRTDVNVHLSMEMVAKAGSGGCGCGPEESPEVTVHQANKTARVYKVKAGRCWITYHCHEWGYTTVCFVVAIECSRGVFSPK